MQAVYPGQWRHGVREIDADFTYGSPPHMASHLVSISTSETRHTSIPSLVRTSNKLKKAEAAEVSSTLPSKR